jgi:hypothetical protein
MWAMPIEHWNWLYVKVTRLVILLHHDRIEDQQGAFPRSHEESKEDTNHGQMGTGVRSKPRRGSSRQICRLPLQDVRVGLSV